MAPRSETTTRIPELDGVRGLACLLVLLWHYFGAPLVFAPTSTSAAVAGVLGAIGRSGVDLFFVLSGFLISGILIDQRGSPNYFRTFYIRRTFRIMPLYLLVFALACACIYLGVADRYPAMNDWLFKDLMPLWSYPVYVQNVFMAWSGHAGGKFLGMTWSVAVEEQFYLLFPLVVCFLPVKSLRYFILGALVAAPILRVVALTNKVWFYTLLPCRIDCLATGILAATLVRNPVAKAYLVENKGMLYAAMLALLGCMIWLSGQSLWYSWIALFYAAAMLLVILHPATVAARFCRWQRLRDLGLISYGVYMYHQPIQGVLHAVIADQVPKLEGARDVGIAVASAILSVLVATASYKYVERHLLALGHGAKWWPEAKPAAEPAGAKAA